MALKPSPGSGGQQRLLATLIFFLLATNVLVDRLFGEDDEGIVANPNRPTVSNPADITQYGVLELEYGIQADSSGKMFCGLLKFAAAKNLELRLDSDTYQSDSSLHESGFGDMDIGFQYRFLQQSKQRPSMSIALSSKIPTATDSLGSGKWDHQILWLASKDIGAYHADLNLDFEFLGRSDASGYDNVVAPALAISHSFKRNYVIAGEISGTTRQNHEEPGTLSTLWAISYSVRPRFVIDSAVSFNLKGPGSNCTFLGGFTYSIADLYHPHHKS